MATYNGAKFLEKQLQSICDQNYSYWRLIIRDDGSNDGTIDIIKKYIIKDKRISLLEDETEQHGAYCNFWTLINYAKKIREYDYYFFADQDDIWEQNKIKIFIQNAEKYTNVPLYMYSDMETIDSFDNQKLKSVNKIMGIDMNNDKYTLFYSQGYVWGCASMINKELFKKVKPLNTSIQYANSISHDNFYAKHGLILGKVKFINQTLIKHRRHDNNTTGEYSMKITPRIILKKGFLFFNDTAKTHAHGYDQTLHTIDWMISEGYADSEILKIKDSILKGGWHGVLQMISFRVKRPQFSRTLGIYVIMLSNKYKKYMEYNKEV